MEIANWTGKVCWVPLEDHDEIDRMRPLLLTDWLVVVFPEQDEKYTVRDKEMIPTDDIRRVWIADLTDRDDIKGWYTLLRELGVKARIITVDGAPIVFVDAGDFLRGLTLPRWTSLGLPVGYVLTERQPPNVSLDKPYDVNHPFCQLLVNYCADRSLGKSRMLVSAALGRSEDKYSGEELAELQQEAFEGLRDEGLIPDKIDFSQVVGRGVDLHDCPYGGYFGHGS